MALVAPPPPHPASNLPLFGVFFVGASYPIYSSNFIMVDPTHWVLDVCTTVQPNYWDLKEISLFLMQPNSLDPSLAVGLYLKVGPSDWLYRGCVHNGHPSEVMPLQIGVSVEPGAEIIQKEGSKLGAREDFAKRVGMDLYRFMESFQTGQVVIKFTDKFRRDPDFLTRHKEQL